MQILASRLCGGHTPSSPTLKTAPSPEERGSISYRRRSPFCTIFIFLTRSPTLLYNLCTRLFKQIKGLWQRIDLHFKCTFKKPSALVTMSKNISKKAMILMAVFVGAAFAAPHDSPDELDHHVQFPEDKISQENDSAFISEDNDFETNSKYDAGKKTDQNTAHEMYESSGSINTARANNNNEGTRTIYVHRINKNNSDTFTTSSIRPEMQDQNSNEDGVEMNGEEVGNGFKDVKTSDGVDETLVSSQNENVEASNDFGGTNSNIDSTKYTKPNSNTDEDDTYDKSVASGHNEKDEASKDFGKINNNTDITNTEPNANVNFDDKNENEVNKQTEKVEANNDLSETNTNTDVTNTKPYVKVNNDELKTWTQVKENKGGNIDDHSKFDAYGEDIRGSVIKSGVTYEVSSQSYNKDEVKTKKDKIARFIHQMIAMPFDKFHYLTSENVGSSVKTPVVVSEVSSPSYIKDKVNKKTKKIGSFMDKVITVPINALHSVNALLNYKFQAATESDADSTSATAHKTKFDYIFNIPITILESVQNVFKWFAE